MNASQQTSPESDNTEFDGLLRNFFRSEMPESWPTWKAPVTAKPTPPVSARRWTAARSKLALAASVAVLTVGSWCLSGGRALDYSQPAGVSPLGDPGAASRSGVKNLLQGTKPGVAPTKAPKTSSGCDCCK